MNRHLWLGTLALLLLGGHELRAGSADCPPPADGFLQRLGPVGGWCPDAGGLLRWWNPHCFPCGCSPDDYCRKPMPCVCWPAVYPSYFIWGSGDTACPPVKCSGKQVP